MEMTVGQLPEGCWGEPGEHAIVEASWHLNECHSSPLPVSTFGCVKS